MSFVSISIGDINEDESLVRRSFNNSEYSDITFKLDDETTFYAVKSVFSKFSPIIIDIRSRSQTTDNIEIEIKNLPFDIFVEIMKKAYGIKIEMEKFKQIENFESFFDLLDYFGMQKFKEDILFYIVTSDILRQEHMTDKLIDHIVPNIVNLIVIKKIAKFLTFEQFKGIIETNESVINMYNDTTGTNILHELSHETEDKILYLIERKPELLTEQNCEGSTPVLEIVKSSSFETVQKIPLIIERELVSEGRDGEHVFYTVEPFKILNGLKYGPLIYSMFNKSFEVFQYLFNIIPEQINLPVNEVIQILSNVVCPQTFRFIILVKPEYFTNKLVLKIITKNYHNDEFITELQTIIEYHCTVFGINWKTFKRLFDKRERKLERIRSKSRLNPGPGDITPESFSDGVMTPPGTPIETKEGQRHFREEYLEIFGDLDTITVTDFLSKLRSDTHDGDITVRELVQKITENN